MKQGYWFRCGNYKCSILCATNGRGGLLYWIPADQVPDGEVWLCRNCREVSGAGPGMEEGE